MDYLTTNSKINCHLSTACLVCEEPVELPEEDVLRMDLITSYYPVKICSKCKEAILRVRDGACTITLVK